MTARTIQAEKFYKKLQKKFSRRINLDRSRIFFALKKFNIDPNHDLPGKVLQVIGSDGKNTVVQSLKSILIGNKKNITTFTSPAIISPLDRIFIKKKFITLKKFKAVSKKIIRSKVKLTLFEILTLIYIKSLKNVKNIDYYINEAGCGWDKDSTNLFDYPKAQIITNLNLQHKDLLGAKNIRDICRIKCGSLSNQTNIYIGKQNPKTLKIIKNFLNKNYSNKYYYGKDFRIKKFKNYFLYSDNKGNLKLKAKQIHSDGLWENVALAIKVARDLNISNKIILKSLPKIEILGRLQFLKKGKLRKLLFSKEDLLLDGCHSEKAIINHIKFIKNINKPKYAIWSLMKNREPEKYVKYLKNFKKIIAINVPDEPNSCSPRLLKKIANQNNIDCEVAKDISSAIKIISSDEDKCVSIIGSLYTAGKALNLN
tara:strand:+ start:1494 stop:2771 length:1278 start_codon:yes stop_codon:yes gene_type:complete